MSLKRFWLFALLCGVVCPIPLAAQIAGIPVFYMPIRDTGCSYHADYGRRFTDRHVLQLRGTMSSEKVTGTLAGSLLFNDSGEERFAGGGTFAYGPWPEAFVLVDLHAGVGYTTFESAVTTYRELDVAAPGAAVAINARLPWALGTIHFVPALRMHYRRWWEEVLGQQIAGSSFGLGTGVGIGLVEPKTSIEPHLVIEYMRIKDPLTDRYHNEWSLGVSIGRRS